MTARWPCGSYLRWRNTRTVRSDDFCGLRHLAACLGDRFRAGIVRYAGGQELPFGEKLTALPISALWTTEP